MFDEFTPRIIEKVKRSQNSIYKGIKMNNPRVKLIIYAVIGEVW